MSFIVLPLILLSSAATLTTNSEPSILASKQWDVVQIEPPEKGSKLAPFTVYLPLSKTKPMPKVGDKASVQAVGDESESAIGTIEKVNENNSGLAVIKLQQYPEAWPGRKWVDKRGFEALIASPPLDDEAYAHHACRFDMLPDGKGVSCETLHYAISNIKGDTILMAFSYSLKGTFDHLSGKFLSDYTGSAIYVKQKKGWKLDRRTLPQ